MQWEIFRAQPVDKHMRIGTVLDLCEEENMSHYPVSDAVRFLGMVRCEDLETLDPDLTLSDAMHFMENFKAGENDDWTKLFAEFLANETNVLPVIDEEGKYKGLIFLEDLLEDLSEINAFNMDGTLIRIRKNTQDFSFSQIGQIVESSGGKLSGILIIEENPQETTADLKVHKGDINEILQNLRRFDYLILSKHEEDLHLKDIREHADFLNKYLKMGE